MSAAAAASWTLAGRLARRELRAGIHGFRIFLACIVIGVAAITAVGWVSAAMVAGLGDDGRRLLGGDLEVRLIHRELAAAPRAWLEARGRVSEIAEMRTMAAAAGGAGPRRLVELRAVDQAYPLYGAVELEPAGDLQAALALRDGLWGAAVEAVLLPRLGVALGELLRIGDLTYEVRAVLAREPDHVGRNIAFGPSIMVARASLAQTGLLQPGSLIHYRYRLRLPAGVSFAGLGRAIQEAFPEAGWRVRNSANAAPGVRHFIDRLGLYLSLVGLAALLIGGLGVGNAVRSYLDGRIATIATLKCLGAPAALVLKTYLLQIALLAAAGIALGLALGAGAAASATWLMGDRFGWQGSFAPHWGPLGLAALFGVLVAAIFTWPPLARAGDIAPALLFRALVAPPGRGLARRHWLAVAIGVAALAGLAIWTATDSWLAFLFVCGTAGSFLVFRLAGLGVTVLARRLPRPKRAGLRLALTNLHRPGAPTAAVVLSLGLGLTVLIAIAQIEGNLSRQMRESLPADAPALYFLDIQPDQTAEFDALVGAVEGVRELRRVPMLRGRITAVNGTPPAELAVPQNVTWVFAGDRGLTWTRTPVPGAELTAGAWWPADYAGPPLVSFDAEVAEALGLGPGDRLTVNVLGRGFEVEIANLRVIDWTTLGINFLMVFSPGFLEGAPQTHIATLKGPPAAEEAAVGAVTERFANVTAIRVREALEAVAELIGHMASAVRLTAAVGLVSGILVLAGAVAAGHERRTYDAVVLKVLGATRPALARAFLVEFGLLGLVTAAIAVVIGSLAARFVLTELMNLGYAFLPGAAFGTAVLGLILTLALGFAGTWRALSQKAAPLLRNE